MPEIKTGAQVFDIAFHPSEPVVFTGLLTGGIKAFRYDEQGNSQEGFSVRPSKRSCRGLATNEDGSQLFAVGKGKALHTLDAATGKLIDSRLGVHQAPINRIKRLKPHLLCTGDDDGVVKLWDPRKPEALKSYSHHFDFISDFMWIDGKRQLVVTSGDGTLSVIDVRSNKPTPFAHSEDQEDELLSIVPIRGGEKTVVGTQTGILSIFNRTSGWGDCVDRVPGHPHSIDALCALPASYPSSHSTILTGSSDGLLRAVQLFPTKLLGVVADHGAFPIERIAVDMGGTGRWVGSIGHDEVLRLTDLREVFEDENKDRDADEAVEGDMEPRNDDPSGLGVDEGSEDRQGENARDDDSETEERHKTEGGKDSDEDGSSDEEPQAGKRRRKGKTEDPLATDKKKKRKIRKDEVVADPSFFAEL
ncbi:WD40 repeat-like protein [Phellopilus nigrolimitatus]|nr:WD40 repeat-like protein [Phellopilus nigrolimitatus]